MEPQTAQKIEPAKLEDFEVRTFEKIDGFEPETLEKRRRLRREGKYTPEDEKELLELIVDAVFEAVREELPGFLSIFISRAMIKRVALFLFTKIGKKIIDLLA